jgi:hypothetical protein
MRFKNGANEFLQLVLDAGNIVSLPSRHRLLHTYRFRALGRVRLALRASGEAEGRLQGSR